MLDNGRSSISVSPTFSDKNIFNIDSIHPVNEEKENDLSTIIDDD